MDMDERLQAVAPDKRHLTERQAFYLAKQAKVRLDELTGIPLAEVHEKLRWRIEPHLLAFRRLCGRVVRENPETGEMEGVPNATVTLEDTDCSFLGFFPVEQPFWWLYPVVCSREVIATVTTDSCGDFCVYIPRWDLDRILRFRKERLCVEIGRPRLPDIIEDVLDIPEFPPRWPEPPGPELRPIEFGLRPATPGPRGPLPSPRPSLEESLSTSSPAEMLSPEVIDLINERLGGSASAASVHPALKGQPDTIPVFGRGAQAPITPKALESLKKVEMRGFEVEEIIPALRHGLIGPFTWCRDVFVPEWQLIVDVPDLTFKVTQDIDGDGNQEIIYNEGFFDIRWNDADPDDVVVVASAAARSTPSCRPPEEATACEDEPDIYAVGEMSLDASYHDNLDGYGVRPNRPRPGGGLTDPQVGPSEAPYRMALNLQACHRLDGATHYRVMYAAEGADFVPLTGLEWDAPATPAAGAPVIHFKPDTDGWYPVVDAGDLAHPDWVLWWPTWRYPHGSYRVRLEVADAAKNLVAPASGEVTFEVDNRRPDALFGAISWTTTTVPSTTLAAQCPVIRRPAGQEVTLTVPWSASAVHFRDAELVARGCGGDQPSVGAGQAHWHTSVIDNAVSQTATVVIPATAPEGVYTLQIRAHGRAFNPEGNSAGPGTDWFFNPSNARHYPTRSIAVIDA